MSLAIFTFAGFLFVDDTDLVAVAESPSETATQVTEKMQRAVNVWHGG